MECCSFALFIETFLDEETHWLALYYMIKQFSMSGDCTSTSLCPVCYACADESRIHHRRRRRQLRQCSRWSINWNESRLFIAIDVMANLESVRSERISTCSRKYSTSAHIAGDTLAIDRMKRNGAFCMIMTRWRMHQVNIVGRTYVV